MAGGCKVSELWGDHGDSLKGAGATVHSCGMQQPRGEHQQPLLGKGYAVALKGMAAITFKLTKAQGTQKRLETLELPLKYVHYLPLRGNIFVCLCLPCSRILGIFFSLSGDPTS